MAKASKFRKLKCLRKKFIKQGKSEQEAMRLALAALGIQVKHPNLSPTAAPVPESKEQV